ncbi:MAG: DUF4388 domain-containing protein [Calditrichaeota bacterium]|nr:MAG: DUF4388 domain-containing protein [Calditrichota bacterium]
MANLIFICEASSELAQQLTAALEKEGVTGKVFASFTELRENAARTVPDAVVLNAAISPDEQASRQLFQEIPTVIYGQGLSIEEQLALYDEGVKRYLPLDETLPTRLAAVIRRILFRITELRRIRQQALTHGTVQAFSLTDVLQNALGEQKNLILKLRHGDWISRIRIFQGHIIEARTPNLADEDAALKILHIPAGTFAIRGYRKAEALSSVRASTLALLAETAFEKKEIQQFLEPFQSTDPRFEVIPSERLTELSSEELQVLDLVEEFGNFREVLLRSPFSVLRTVRLLKEFLEREVMAPAGKGREVETFQPEDIRYLREHLFEDEVHEGHLIVLGLPTSGRTELIRTIAGHQNAPLRSLQSLDFTRLRLQPGLTLSIFGISIDAAFLPILEKLSQAMVAVIFLIDYTRTAQYEFSNYVLNQLIRIYDVPFVIGLTNLPEDAGEAVTEFHRHFTVPKGISVLPVKTDSFADIRRLLHHLRKVPTRKDKETTNA